MRFKVNALIALGLMLMASAAAAHHNMSAIFDFNARVTLTGTLTKYDWRNPHIELTMETQGDRIEVQTWRFEGPAPTVFRTREVTKVDFEQAVGKSLTVEISRARDGSRWGLIRNVTLPDGKTISLCPQNC